MTTEQTSTTEYQQQPKTPPSPTEPPSHPKNKLLLPLILTLFLLLITLIVVGVFAFKYYTTSQTTTISTKNQPNSTITPLKESPSPTPDPTANWKTYTNKEYGFEFKYPSYLQLNNTKPLSGSGLTVILKLGTQLKLSVRDPKFEKDFISRYWSDAKVSYIDNIEIRKKTLQSSAIGGGHPYLTQIDYLINLPQANILISYQEAKEGDLTKFSSTLNQIISSLKFLDANSVILDSPTDISSISSPLTIKGKAKSNWFSEGVFPIKLLDENRQLISSTNARELIPGSWVTQEWVAFTASINFNSQSPTGILVFEKSNPSGLSKNDDAVEYRVTFKLPNNK